MNSKPSTPNMWSSRLVFILAAAGSAVGLGNIWKFPYIVGENGGGAFVLVYLACICIVGLPIMIAEISLGKSAQQDSVTGMEKLAKLSKASTHWKIISIMGCLSTFIILSFYSVVAAWILSYIYKLGSGEFMGASLAESQSIFHNMISNPKDVLMYQSIFLITTFFVLARGVSKGIETASKIMMPMLIILLLVLLGFSVNSDTFNQGFQFMFAFDFSKITSKAIVVALGHSFFTLSVGMTIMMVYGAYMPKKSPIVSTAFFVSAMDTGIALIAGLVIFPIVFKGGLEPSAGPGLMFHTLPIAFSSIPGGSFFGALFFLLVAFAAWTSAFSLLEPSIAWVKSLTQWPRTKVVAVLGFALWCLSLLSVFSFSTLSDIKIFGKTFFDAFDFLTANILLPLGGILIAIFSGWIINTRIITNEIGDGKVCAIWRFLIRYVSPTIVLFVAINALT